MVRAFAIDPLTPTTLYAGTLGGGVFKSANGGGSWDAINTGLMTNTDVAALAIDPLTPTTLYAGTPLAFLGTFHSNSGVFKSTDGGESWSASSTGLTAEGAAAGAGDPPTPPTLYAGARGGDGGVSAEAGGGWRDKRHE